MGFGESVSPRFRSADRVFLERVAHVTQEAVVFATFATEAQTVIHANGPVTPLSFNAERAIEHTGAQHVLLELSTRVDDLGTLVTQLRHNGEIQLRIDLPALRVELARHFLTDRRFHSKTVTMSLMPNTLLISLGSASYGPITSSLKKLVTIAI